MRSSYRQPSLGEGFVSGIAVDRVLSYIACLRRSSSLFFIPLVPYPARFARHLPHAGKALSVGIVFPHMHVFALTMREKRYSRIVSLPHWGRGTASAVDRVFSQTAYLRRSLPTLFHTAFPIQPPPLRGTSFHRKEGMATRAPSLGRGCRAQRGGVGFLLGRRSGAFVNGLLETHFPTLFHTTRTLSGSLRSPPSPRGEGFVSGIAVSPYRSLVFPSLRAKRYPHRLSISPRNPRA